MNIFRLCGDLAHLLAIIILLLKIWKTRSCAGKLKKSALKKIAFGKILNLAKLMFELKLKGLRNHIQ